MNSNIISVSSFDGIKLRVAVYHPVDDPIGIIQVVHGFGEGLEHYEYFVDFFVENKYICVVHDQRGFGKMPDLSVQARKIARGVTPSYNHLLKDIKVIRNKIDELYPRLPVFLFGFSMGGNIAINYLLNYSQKDYDKLILESPWLRLYKKISPLANQLGKIVGNISPKFKTSSRLSIQDITRDEKSVEMFTNDDVYHDQISFRLYSSVRESGEYAIKNADKISIPTLLIYPEEDKIVSSSAIREFINKAEKNIESIEYKGGYHNLHLDIINSEVLNEVLDFCNKKES